MSIHQQQVLTTDDFCPAPDGQETGGRDRWRPRYWLTHDRFVNDASKFEWAWPSSVPSSADCTITRNLHLGTAIFTSSQHWWLHDDCTKITFFLICKIGLFSHRITILCEICLSQNVFHFRTRRTVPELPFFKGVRETGFGNAKLVRQHQTGSATLKQVRQHQDLLLDKRDVIPAFYQTYWKKISVIQRYY